MILSSNYGSGATVVSVNGTDWRPLWIILVWQCPILYYHIDYGKNINLLSVSSSSILGPMFFSTTDVTAFVSVVCLAWSFVLLTEVLRSQLLPSDGIRCMYRSVAVFMLILVHMLWWKCLSESHSALENWSLQGFKSPYHDTRTTLAGKGVNLLDNVYSIFLTQAHTLH